ncbi:MAG: fructose-6-phosphate aldolase [Candidatus Diapherotrites archaeon]|uniref:Probable transaldolase n=1 Tax=Candidatus Iainarchaeum sp. TaxID=3101447 RepID=A0A7J4ITN2_9ARCH|nr:MAG: transaldolase [archaeon GW2011_AR10]MBS3059603.1 fructose-6-phosphate aldolase [Candidatus Diapherotrites archaeon]HIH08812.1 fructose-6-phosphate aldolase [Candidatus Diapherotrites archaeon]
MQIFADTADVEKIRELNAMGVIDGVTTNPTLVMKAGRDFNEILKEITSIVDGPISAETVSSDAKGMIKEAAELSKIHKNIVIKIVNTPEGLKAVKQLAGKGIKTNVTLTFSANQALLAAKAGATYVSPFIGRLDDVGEDGMQVIRDIVQIYRNYGFKTKVLVASVRGPLHVLEAAKIGADACTCPPEVIEKMFKHPLTDAGIKRFLEDWEKARKNFKK